VFAIGLERMATRWLTLADADHVATAARACDVGWLDDAFDARQVVRQRPRLAGRAGLRPWSGCAGRDLLLDRGDLRLRLGDGGLEILQRQFQLRWVKLLRLRPELRVSILPDLALQLPDQLLELGNEGVLLGHYRLLVQPGGALDGRIEPGRFQRRVLSLELPHHLGRKVGEPAEIEGLRHAPFYPIRAGKPNKTRAERIA
jgi:hypothetical protein